MCYPAAAYQMDLITLGLSMLFHKIAPAMIGSALIGIVVDAQSTYSRLYLLTGEVRDWMPTIKSHIITNSILVNCLTLL